MKGAARPDSAGASRPNATAFVATRSGAGGEAGSWFKGLRPVWLYRREYAAFAGTVGTDADGRLLVEAGEDVTGEQYVDVIAEAKDLDPKIRRAIADKMIALWSLFAEGGAEPGANKKARRTKSGAGSPSSASMCAILGIE